MRPVERYKFTLDCTYAEVVTRERTFISETDVVHPIEISSRFGTSTALPQQPGSVLGHHGFVIALDQQHPVGHGVFTSSKGCFACPCPASIAIHNEEMNGAEAPSSGEHLRFARQYAAQVRFASEFGSEPEGLEIVTSAKSARCLNATQVLVHIPERRHNLLGPLRRMVQVLQVGLGCKHIRDRDRVQDQKLRPEADNGVPATLEETRDREALLHVLVGVPVEVLASRPSSTSCHAIYAPDPAQPIVTSPAGDPSTETLAIRIIVTAIANG
jgi:hypothetical protein